MNKYKINLTLGFLMGAIAIARGEPLTAISSDNAQLQYSGYVHKELVSSSEVKSMRFDRELDMPGKGYRWDNPGASIRFRTDAAQIEAVLNYTDRHISTTARNAVGIYSVDGVFKPTWSFQSRQRTVAREPETVVVPFMAEAPGMHDYELFLPYGDSVEFGGLKISAGAKLVTVAEKSSIRYVAYGDSITHGFSASRISKTYPFLVGKEKGWETINLGLGGRSSNPDDGKVIASLKPDIVTVLMGANDWQVGVPLARYRSNMDGFIKNIRSAGKDIPIYLMTPLWVKETWNPAGKIADLEEYRQALRDLVAALKDPNLYLFEGPELIDAVPKLYDQAPIHPNDAGFAMMAERLAQKLHDLKKK